MYSLPYLKEQVDNAFQNIKWLSKPHELYQPIDYTLSLGGKRIRPLLVLLGNDLFGGEPDRAIMPAIATEIFHNFTLLHDDIMDQAPLRRGKETVFKKWDLNTAILSGDTMFALAYEYLAKVNHDDLPDVLELFTTTARQVCEGQQYDMNFERQDDITIDNYLQMIRLKTAVLIACSLKLGAIIARASKEESAKLYTFGENLGMAFQLQDDLLDAFGDEGIFGKEIGGDIVTGKKTFLFLKAFELAGTEEKALLVNSFLDSSLPSQTKISIVKEIYLRLNMPEITNHEIENYFLLALDALNSINVPDDNKAELRTLSESLFHRIS